MPRFVLASASPRRSQLLRALDADFLVAPSPAEEPAPSPADGLAPGAFVERLAQLKAAACREEGLILAADTVVVLNDQILGKPRDEGEALRMLERLSGRTHRVFTGLCLRHNDEFWLEHEITRVTFGAHAREFLQAYVGTGEPMDKAGAYGAQGRGALLIERIEGDYFNVVGLPLFRLAKMLRARGIEVASFWNEKENASS